jgi:hypothetical protein
LYDIFSILAILSDVLSDAEDVPIVAFYQLLESPYVSTPGSIYQLGFVVRRLSYF